MAISQDFRDDVTGSKAVAWKVNRRITYLPSPVLCHGGLYFNQSNDAILSSVDLRPGEFQIERTGMPDLSRIYASPIASIMSVAAEQHSFSTRAIHSRYSRRMNLANRSTPRRLLSGRNCFFE